MSENLYIRNDQIVSALASSIRKGSSGLHNVPGLLKQIIRDGMWRARDVEATGEHVTFKRFVDFIRADPPDGLGAEPDMLRRLCVDDPEAQALLEAALTQGKGNPTGHNQYTEQRGNVDIINISSRPDGTSRAQALRRLRASRPDLHERVIVGEISPHAAMVEAGYRKQTITVPLDTEAAAAAILRHFTSEQVADLVARLLSLKA